MGFRLPPGSGDISDPIDFNQLGTTPEVELDVREVETLSGSTVQVIGEPEVEFYKQAQEKYLSENKFTIASDLRNLDRLIMTETLLYRWQNEVSSERDSRGQISPVALEVKRRSIKDAMLLVGKLHQELGLTKSQRDANTDTVGSYILELKHRAKEFGIHREKQLGKAMELLQELFGIVGSFDRSNDREKEYSGFASEKEIVEWIRKQRAEYDAIDEYFRKNQQRFWVRQL